MDNLSNSYSSIQQHYNVWAILGFVFAFIIPVLGLIFGIIGLTAIKKDVYTKGKGLAIAGIVISLIFMVVAVVFIIFTINKTTSNITKEKAVGVETVNNVRQIQTALQLYFDTNNKKYPSAPVYVLGTRDAVKFCAEGFVDFTTNCSGVYIDKLPGGENGKTSYTYKTNGDRTTYGIEFMLTSTVENMQAGWKCARPSGIENSLCPFSL